MRVENTGARDDVLVSLEARIAAGATTDELLALLKSLVRVHPDQALALAQAVARNNNEKFILVTGVVRSWAQADPQAAWDWMLTFPGGVGLPHQSVLVSTILMEMAKTDPNAVVDRVDAALETRAWTADLSAEQATAAQLIDAAVTALIASGNVATARAAVESWASGANIGPVDERAFEAVASALGATSRLAGAHWLESLPASASRSDAFAGYAMDWTATDPEAATRWADGLGDGGDALRQAFGRWLETDTTTAMQWLGNRLLGGAQDPRTDRLLADAVEQEAGSAADPKSLLTWADAITDPGLWGQSLKKLVAVWAQRDPAAAARYLAADRSLPPAEKTVLLSTLRNPGAVPDW